MRHQKSFARRTVDVVKGNVVLTMSPAHAHQIAMVIDDARPREDWLRETVLSILTAADRLGIRSEEIRRRVDWLDASAAISRELLRSSSSVMVVVQEIANHVLRLSNGRSLTIAVAFPDDPALLEVRVAAGVGSAVLVGRTLPRGPSVAGSAMAANRGHLENTGNLHSLQLPAGSSSASRPVMAVPIPSGGGHPRGAIVVHRRPDQPPFDATDLSMAEDFAWQTSLALELAEERVVHDRQQEKREHDEAAHALHSNLLQRLFFIGMTVQSAEADLRRGEDSPSVRQAEAHLARAVDDLNDTIREGRASLRPPVFRQPDEAPAAVATPVTAQMRAASAPAPETTGATQAAAGSSMQKQEMAASLVHAAAVDAAKLAQEAVHTAADRAAEAASAARVQRSVAVENAAEAVAARVAAAAAAVESEADAAALTVAQAAFDAALLIASTVAPGTERDAALTATLVATAVSAIAIKTAALTASARADVAHEAAMAASAAAVAAADAATLVDLEVACAAEAVRAVATEAALTLAERIDAEASAFALTLP